jgi:pyruvate formate lyase activating enzyme
MMLTVFDIKRFAVHDGPGIRTTVFLKGCPLSCWWCHNPESQSMKPVTVDIERKVNGKSVAGKKVYGKSMEVEAVLQSILRDTHFYEESGGGVTFSGGEPLMQAAGLKQLLEGCKQHGLHTTVDTSGHAGQEQLDGILPLTDLFLYDLKHMDPELHLQYTGVDNELILANADRLIHGGANLVFRIPVIPGINTTPEEVDGMVRFITERAGMMKELHLLPYHRIADNKYQRLQMKQHLKDLEGPTETEMQHLKKTFEQTGLEVIIGG